MIFGSGHDVRACGRPYFPDVLPNVLKINKTPRQVVGSCINRAGTSFKKAKGSSQEAPRVKTLAMQVWLPEFYSRGSWKEKTDSTKLSSDLLT